MRFRGPTGGLSLRPLLLTGSLILALAASGTGLSGATFVSSTASRQSQLAASSDWVPPLVSIANPGAAIRGTVSLAATASDPFGSGVASIRFQRALSGTEAWSEICVAVTAPYSCSFDTTKLANELYDLRAVATDVAGFVSTDTVSEVQVDNREPSVTMIDPGSVLTGVVTLGVEASDEDSGVASVAIQSSPAGKSTWTTICTLSEIPYSCRFDTRTVAEGSYDLRAVAVDLAGNSKASAVLTARRIDNTISSVSLEDPGAYLHGSVTLSANASSTAGVASVTIQRSPAGKSTWTEICRDTSSPYGCSFDTTTVPDGSYDFRAIMATAGGGQVTSATVASRQVDNTETRGSDVQATNHAGGVVGKIESGDSISVYYSKLINPASIVSGWSGAVPTAIYLRLRDGNLLGTGSSGDTLQFSTDSSGSKPIGLGSVNLHGDFIKTNKTSTFAATLAASTRSVGTTTATTMTVTVGALASGGALRTSASAAAMVWAPSAAATDLSGSACSAAPVTESGTLDRDF
jgi:hypothetical protein